MANFEIEDAKDIKIINSTTGEVLMVLEYLDNCDITREFEGKSKEDGSENMSCKYEAKCSRVDIYCNECMHNPNAKLQDYFLDKGYVSTCKYEYYNCINDPAYLEKDGYEGESCDGCLDGSWYDDEDK